MWFIFHKIMKKCVFLRKSILRHVKEKLKNICQCGWIEKKNIKLGIRNSQCGWRANWAQFLTKTGRRSAENHKWEKVNADEKQIGLPREYSNECFKMSSFFISFQNYFQVPQFKWLHFSNQPLPTVQRMFAYSAVLLLVLLLFWSADARYPYYASTRKVHDTLHNRFTHSKHTHTSTHTKSEKQTSHLFTDISLVRTERIPRGPSEILPHFFSFLFSLSVGQVGRQRRMDHFYF